MDIGILSRHHSRSVNRLNHALNYAHVHSDKDLSLDLLANRACLSKYHFSRLFQDYTGESPIRFVKRIRLENAAHWLCYRSDMTITSIALNSGFSSNPTFTRAFVSKFGLSPREFRTRYTENLEYALSEEKANQYSNVDQRDNDDTVLQTLRSHLKFVYQPPIRVAYFRNIGAYGISDGIDHAILSIREWASSQKLLNHDLKVIGASWDSNKITPNTFCKYDACIPLPRGYSPDNGISVQTLPGGFYAVSRAAYRHPGEISLIWRQFMRLLRRSPELTGYRTSATPCREIFDKNLVTGEPTIELHIRLLHIS